MKVMRLVKGSGGWSLESAEVAGPVAGPGELVVAVHAAGVTPSELLWYPTEHRADGSERRDTVPGHEFSGVISAVGFQVQDYRVGSEVFGMNDWFADGATAELCVTQAAMIAPKPGALSHAEAATVPIAALTATQGLDRLQLRAGERLLVTGASGSVGSFVVQLAKARGAYVLGTASAASLGFVLSLGAKEALDYRADPFARLGGQVDAVFDCVGGETLQQCWSVVGKGSRVVTIAAASEGHTEQRVKDAFFIVESNGLQLAEIGRQFDRGQLRTFVKSSVPLDQAAIAYFSTEPGMLPYGKNVITMF